jgi:hypothetical protein
VRGSLQSYDVVSAHEVDVTIAVERESGDAVECLVRALALDHAIVAEQTVTIPAGNSGSTRFVATIPTEREATSVTVTGCQSAG